MTSTSWMVSDWFRVTSIAATAGAVAMSFVAFLLKLRIDRKELARPEGPLSVKVEGVTIVLEGNAEIEKTVRTLTHVLDSRSRGESVSTLTLR